MPPAERRRSTSQQDAAITTLDRNVVVVAGAGTGKTTVLVQRFIELLARNPAWPLTAIVAITFTNRAADEMRSRIRQALEQRIREAPPEDVRRWRGLLTQIEAARITTIHGLCADIIRANAATAAIDPGFDVLNETQAALLRDDAVTLALADAVSGGMLIDQQREQVANVITRYNENEIRESLKKAALLNADLADVRNLDALYEEWTLHTANLLYATPLPALTYTPPQTDDLMASKYVAALLDLTRVRNADLPLDERIASLHNLARITLRGGSKAKWPDVADAKEELRALREAAEPLCHLIGEPPSEQDEQAAELLRGWMLLITITRIQYERLKRAKNALDYDDLERLAANVLREPDVAARYVNAEFRHIMVDEFQDTNLRQWNIVKAIAPPEQAGLLFLVGDPKQSIYSFRGADVTVFDRARTEIVAHGGVVLYLSESFRTHLPLVETLNSVFATALTCPPVAINKNVYITFDETQRLRANRLTPPDGLFAGAFGVAKVNGERQIITEARAVAQYIRTLVNSRAELVWQNGGYRPVRYGDIALLLRSFHNKVEVFERALLAERIPYITLGGRGFFGRREVRDLIVALRALHNPADELSLAAMLHGPLFAISDADLLTLRRTTGSEGQPMPMLSALFHEADQRRTGAYNPIVYAADALRRILPLAGRVPVESLLQALLGETGYLATLAGLPDGRQMRANVEKLIDHARDSGLTALNLFVRYLDDMTEAEVKEGGVPLDAEDAVRLTTIHSSKGLEYPVVWIADASERTRRGDRDILNWSAELGTQLPKLDQRQREDGKPLHPYVHRRNRILADEREDAESRRILYVAATRAKDAVFVSGPMLNDGDVKGWLKMVEGSMPRSPLTAQPPRPIEQESPAETDDGVQDYPLARALPRWQKPTRLHLSASDIRALGGMASANDDGQRRRCARRLRQRVFAADTEPIALLTYDAKIGQISGQKTGIIIHDALRFGYDTLLDRDRPRAEALIRAMAWEAGITQRNDLDIVADRAIGALTRYNASTLAHELRHSDAVYRELPFVYRRDGHVVHGVIDALYRRPDGLWTLVDYKTDYVETPEALAAHARMYYLQMAVYAEAVTAQTGKPPRVLLVFLHFPHQPVELDNAALRAELENVPFETITELLTEKTPS